MSKVKLTENERLLIQRMTYSGGRAIKINENKENEFEQMYGITEARFKTLCRLKVLVRDKQPDGTMDVVFGSWGKNYSKREFTENPPRIRKCPSR